MNDKNIITKSYFSFVPVLVNEHRFLNPFLTTCSVPHALLITELSKKVAQLPYCSQYKLSQLDL